MSDSEYIRYLESTLQRIGKLAGCKGEVPAEIVEQHVAEASNKLKADIEQWRKAWKGHDERIAELEKALSQAHLDYEAALKVVNDRNDRIAELERRLRGDYGQGEDGKPIVGPSGSIYAQRSDG